MLETPDKMSGFHLHQIRVPLPAFSGDMDAAIRKLAPWGDINQIRYRAGNGLETIPRSVAADAGNGLHQPDGIGMTGPLEKVHGPGMLHNLSGIHDHGPIRHFRNDAEIVCDHEDGHVGFLTDIAHEIEDLGLYGHIQCGRGLVCNQDGRAPG